jgi:hypothetical protein
MTSKKSHYAIINNEILYIIIVHDYVIFKELNKPFEYKIK